MQKIETNTRMGKTRNLLKKTGEIKGTFYAKTGMIKDRNSKDLTGAEEIKKSSKTTQRNCTEKIFMSWTTMVV